MKRKARSHPIPRRRDAVPTLVERGEDEPETLQALVEAERSIGVNEWIDPETGEPAEGQSPPHLDEE